ncbi:MAG: hypothetical protein KGI63_04000 [Xanthomonadaceae bacterium]|nr:hypothetical protein [Xanthomonadaceae bacterium]MDE2278989.1 hypothetical protein [Xanthomonadaceae bacterium]
MNTLLILLPLLSVLLLASAVRRVPTGQVYSLYRGGKLVRVLSEGTHFILPWRERVAHKIDLTGQTLQLAEPLDESRELRGTVYWQVLEPERADAVIDQVNELIRRGAQQALRGGVHADRHELGVCVKRTLNGTLRERGMMVTRVELELAAA